MVFNIRTLQVCFNWKIKIEPEQKNVFGRLDRGAHATTLHGCKAQMGDFSFKHKIKV